MTTELTLLFAEDKPTRTMVRFREMDTDAYGPPGRILPKDKKDAAVLYLYVAQAALKKLGDPAELEVVIKPRP